MSIKRELNFLCYFTLYLNGNKNYIYPEKAVLKTNPTEANLLKLVLAISVTKVTESRCANKN